MIGKGRYDDELTGFIRRTKAQGAVLIVIGGRLGDGFSMKVDERFKEVAPSLLEMLAKAIRNDIQKVDGKPVDFDFEKIIHGQRDEINELRSLVNRYHEKHGPL